jgi:RNA polymerase sigma-70 factor, ECF subfamily
VDLSQLMRQVASGSERAMADLMSVTRHPLRCQARMLVFDRSKAAEVVQDTFVAVWCGRHTYDPSKAAWPWIKQILRSKCNSYWRMALRNRAREEPIDPQLDYEGYVSCVPNPARQAENTQQCRIAFRVLGELSPGIRDVVLLSLFRDLSDLEIADVLGIPLGTAKSRKNRGLSHIRRCMKAHDKENEP